MFKNFLKFTSNRYSKKILLLLIPILGIVLVSSSFFLKKSFSPNSSAQTAPSAYSTYSGDLSSKFQEQVVFSLTDLSQVYASFSNYREIIPGQPLPSQITFNQGELTLTNNGGIVIQNPLKDDSFYRVEVEMEDTGQTNLVSYLTMVDKLWQEGGPSGESLGIDTAQAPYTYFYESTDFTKEEQRLCNSPDAEDKRKCDFSKKHKSKFVMRETKTIKLSYYVTPLGIYAMANGANFSSLPNLYTGSYTAKLSDNKPNYLILGKWNQGGGGNPIKFKNLKVIKLDSTVANNVDEINAFFIKKTVESEDFKQDVEKSKISTEGDGGDLLWYALAYRIYDYYFKTDHLAEVRQLYSLYLPKFRKTIDEKMAAQLAKQPPSFEGRALQFCFDLLSSAQFQPTATYGLSGYLTKDQLQEARVEYAKLIDFVMEYIVKPNNELFASFAAYQGASIVEELGWTSALMSSYVTAFPEDTTIRKEKIIDYVNFLSYTGFSDGRSIEEVYGNKVIFKHLGPEYRNFKYQSIWADGTIDQHGFHPSVNYGAPPALTSKPPVVSTGVEYSAITNYPYSDMLYQVNVANHLDLQTLRHKTPVTKNGSFTEDIYTYQTTKDKAILDFEGTTLPSLLEDWGNTYDWYYLFDSNGQPEKTDAMAKNVYFLKYSNQGDLFIRHGEVSSATGQKLSFSRYNSQYAYAPWYLIFSPRSGFKPTEGRPALDPFSDFSVSLSGPTQATAGQTVNYTTASGNGLPMAGISMHYALKNEIDSLPPTQPWKLFASCTNLSKCPGVLPTDLAPGDYYIALKAKTTDNRNCSSNPTCRVWGADNKQPAPAGCWGFEDCGPSDYLVLRISPAPTSSPVSLSLSNIGFSTGKAVSVDRIRKDVRYYADRDYYLTENPPAEINNLTLIKTHNDDKKNTSGNYLSFTLNKKSTVYILYDKRIVIPPNWLSSFTKAAFQVKTSDGSASPFKVYWKTFPAGKVILGGNNASKAKWSGSSFSNYFVVVK